MDDGDLVSILLGLVGAIVLGIGKLGIFQRLLGQVFPCRRNIAVLLDLVGQIVLEIEYCNPGSLGELITSKHVAWDEPAKLLLANLPFICGPHGFSVRKVSWVAKANQISKVGGEVLDHAIVIREPQAL